MKAIYSGLLCAALLPLVATPAMARSTGGLVSGAIGSAIRHAGDGGEDVVVPEGMISAADPQTIIDLLQSKGFRASLTTDSYGDPQIETAAEGVDYTVDFYGCTDGANCDSVLFTVGFNMDDGTTYEYINEWNKTHAIAGAYVDEEMDPFLDMYVLTKSGVPSETFDAAIDEWTMTLSEFIDYIDW